MTNAIVEADRLVKTFKGGIRALDGLSLTIPPGGIYGLLGPNGAGKTTLIRVLTTLLPADGGSARVAGVDVRADPAAVRARIGLAGQSAAVDDLLTGRENVEMVGLLYGLPRRQARRRAAEVLDGIGLTGAADRQVRTYSGGMRRRLDLAASLAGRPQVLFLDEPTSGLDPASRHDLWALIHDLVGSGTTVLLTTQYLEEADQLAGRVAVIDHGRLIGEGTAEQLKDRVGGAVVELRVPEPDQASTLIALRDAGIGEPTWDPRRGEVTVAAPGGAASLAAALRAVDAAGVTAEAAALRKPTLDDVFLALTGHTATTAVADGPLDGPPNGQVGGPSGGQLGGQVGGPPGGQVGGQVGGPPGGQVGGAPGGPPGGQVGGPPGSQVGDQVGDQVGGQGDGRPGRRVAGGGGAGEAGAGAGAGPGRGRGRQAGE